MSWKQEIVWVARNDRGDIIRAQDMSPQDAIKQAENIYRKVMDNERAQRKPSDGLHGV